MAEWTPRDRAIMVDVSQWSPQRDWENPAIYERNRARMHVPLRSFRSTQAALSYFTDGPDTAERPAVLDLNGEWQFQLFDRPEQVADGFWKPEYDDNAWCNVSTCPCFRSSSMPLPNSFHPFFFLSYILHAFIDDDAWTKTLLASCLMTMHGGALNSYKYICDTCTSFFLSFFLSFMSWLGVPPIFISKSYEVVQKFQLQLEKGILDAFWWYSEDPIKGTVYELDSYVNGTVLMQPKFTIPYNFRTHIWASLLNVTSDSALRVSHWVRTVLISGSMSALADSVYM